MIEAVGVKAVNGDQRRLVVARLEPRQQFATPRHHVRDGGDEAAVLDGHEDRVGKRAAFDAEF